MDNKILKLLEKAEESSFIVYTEYLTPNIYNKLQNKYRDITISYTGKIRRMYAFFPKYYTLEDIEFPQELIKISVNNKFKDYTNRDFLGSIMALNIDRKYLGDMFVDDNVCYVYAHKKIVDILLTLSEVGKNECSIEIVEDRKLDFKFEDNKYIISSNRVDNIISAITKLSRTKAQEYIKLGLVQVDYEECLDNSKIIKDGTILSIKKYGRYLVEGQSSSTKKGKPVIIVKKFI